MRPIATDAVCPQRRIDADEVTYHARFLARDPRPLVAGPLQQLQIQVHYDPSNPPKRTDPDDPEAIEVTYRKPKGAATAARLVGEGWLQEWSAEMNLGAKMTATLTVKFTGLLNVVKAA